jgi:hypothetical protein
MRIVRMPLFVACAFCVSMPAVAQNVSSVDVSGDHVLTQQAARTQAVASSFEALQSVLKVDQELRVNEGIVDSEWNGFLIGVAAGAGLACALNVCSAGLMYGSLGGLIGYGVDRSIHSGRSITGKVVSVSSNQLVISRPRSFRRRVDLAFTENLVTSIRIEDSVWIGAILGAVPLAAGIEVACSLRNCHRGNLWGLVYYVYVFPAGALGATIDGLITRRVYDRRPGPPRVTIARLFGEGRKGVVAQVRF